jgi:hypothetical protein
MAGIGFGTQLVNAHHIGAAMATGVPALSLTSALDFQHQFNLAFFWGGGNRLGECSLCSKMNLALFVFPVVSHYRLGTTRSMRYLQLRHVLKILALGKLPSSHATAGLLYSLHQVRLIWLRSAKWPLLFRRLRYKTAICLLTARNN